VVQVKDREFSESQDGGEDYSVDALIVDDGGQPVKVDSAIGGWR